MIDTFAELEELPRWMAWREELRRSKRGTECTTKVPYAACAGNYGTSGGWGSATDPATWGTRRQAEARAATLANGRMTGIGYVLGPIDDTWTVAGSDLDSCLDENRSLAPWAADILDAVRSYAEISPSSTGIKIFFCLRTSLVRPFLTRIGVEADAWGTKRSVPGSNGANHGPAIEIYFGARYFTVTEQLWDPARPHIVLADQDTLDRLAPLIPPPSDYVLPAASGKAGNTDVRPSKGGDNSRSAQAARIAIVLAPDSYEEMVDGLRHHPHADIRAWVDDKGEAHHERELKRIWRRFAERRANARAAGLADLEERAGPAPPENIEPDPRVNGHATTEKRSGNPSVDENFHTDTSWAGPPPDEDPWPEIASEAFHGLAGAVVDTLAPQTEADPVALLLTFLAEAGNQIGRGPFFQVGGKRHYLNLFLLLIGETAKARKGTAAADVQPTLELADETWQIQTGLSSGEGVIDAVHDEIRVREKVKAGKSVEYQTVVRDPGIADKRLMIIEEEFGGALEVMRREGSILSRVLRDAWDGRKLATMTKHSPTRATGAHVSIIGHITTDELRDKLDRTSMFNGYANRLLLACVRRSQMLPFGGEVDPAALDDFARRMREIRQAAHGPALARRITFHRDTRPIWQAEYALLSAAQPGLLGAVTARAEAQTARLATLYAVLDGSAYIEPKHLAAALAVWRYCEASAKHIFGDATGNPIADDIMAALRRNGSDGMTRTQISELFGNNRAADKIGAALAFLLSYGKARCVKRPRAGGTPGRPLEVWLAC